MTPRQAETIAIGLERHHSAGVWSEETLWAAGQELDRQCRAYVRTAEYLQREAYRPDPVQCDAIGTMYGRAWRMRDLASIIYRAWRDHAGV